MFKDAFQTSIEIKQVRGGTKSFAENGSQTHGLLTNNAGCQSYEVKDGEVQTDPLAQAHSESNPADVDKFISKVSGIMTKNLQENLNSRAFFGLESIIGLAASSVSESMTLRHAGISSELAVTCLSWNSFGSVIGVAYGNIDHEDFCSHKGVFCTWNVDRGHIDHNKADVNLDTNSCLVSIQFHPKLPNLCAGGTFDGEVIIWDLAKTDDMEVFVSRNIPDNHQEPVTNVSWSESESGKELFLLTLCMGGKILLWQIKLSRYKNPKLSINKAFILTGHVVPRHYPSAPTNRNINLGGTSLGISGEYETSFVVGTESGLLLRCSTISTADPGVECGVDIKFHSPVTLIYHGHNGPVYDISFSPFLRNLFITCSTDSTIRIFHLHQTKPLTTIEPAAGYIFNVEWSPTRPMVFAAVTGDGRLLIYDMHANRISPVINVPANTKKDPVYCARFNTKNHECLATGDAKGKVVIWKLSRGLFTEVPGENRLLGRIRSSHE